MSFTK